MNMNRKANLKNPFQGEVKKVLCCCSAGLLRSPTAAVVLSQPPYDFNTRCVGVVKEYALIPLDDALLYWADEIVVMEHWQSEIVDAELVRLGLHTVVKILGIDDDYPYRDPNLMSLIAARYDSLRAIAP